MTRDKARKRAIRTRVTKTGERYTAARRHLTRDAEPPPGVDLGQSDANVRKSTGHGWSHWLRVLDDWGGTDHTHTEIARYLREDLGVPGWWAQTVAVGYERARGMRAPHQTTKGFAVGVSKTLPIGAGVLYREFTDARRRARWLERGTLKVRTTRENRDARFDFRGDGSRVHVYLEAKGPEKTTVTIQHERLPGAEAVEEMRAFWKERLARLAETL